MPNPSDATFMPPRDTLEAPNGQTLSLCPTAVMGIINVTPDSFSDGGRYTTPEQASARAATLRAAGAAIVDIGPYFAYGHKLKTPVMNYGVLAPC